MDIHTLENAVNNIEADIFNQTNIEYFNVLVTSNGAVQIVKFLDVTLWSSEEDVNIGLEPIEQHLRRRIIEELDKLKLISIL